MKVQTILIQLLLIFIHVFFVNEIFFIFLWFIKNFITIYTLFNSIFNIFLEFCYTIIYSLIDQLHGRCFSKSFFFNSGFLDSTTIIKEVNVFDGEEKIVLVIPCWAKSAMLGACLGVTLTVILNYLKI